MAKLMTIQDVRGKLKPHLKDLKEKYGIESLKIFGSVVSGSQHAKSDVDLLVEFEEDSSLTLLQFIALEREIGSIVGRKVDLVESTTLKPAIGKRILAEAEAI